MSLGLLGNNVVLGEADVESFFAGPRFVRVTAVTAMGHRVPVVLGQRVAQLREPGRHQVWRRWSHRAGDPCRLPCRPQRRLCLFPLRGLCRPNYRAVAGWLHIGVSSNGRIFMGVEMILQGIRNTLPDCAPSSTAPRRPDPSRLLIHCNE